MLDGIRIPVSEKFGLVAKDGTLYMVNAPHDPLLPVGEVVNCRCHAIPVVGRFAETA